VSKPGPQSGIINRPPEHLVLVTFLDPRNPDDDGGHVFVDPAAVGGYPQNPDPGELPGENPYGQPSAPLEKRTKPWSWALPSA
jgi:hypothetical protein